MMLRQRKSARVLFVSGCLLGAAVFAGCSDAGPIDVSCRYAEGTKLHGLGPTFAWAPAPPADPGRPPLGTAELRDLIRGTIEKELAAKGFSKSTSGPADFWIDYRIGKKEKTDSGVNPHGEVFNEGSLVLDVVDPQNGKLIWRGVAQTRLLPKAAPEVREKRLDGGIKRLMKEFPPK